MEKAKSMWEQRRDATSRKRESESWQTSWKSGEKEISLKESSTSRAARMLDSGVANLQIWERADIQANFKNRIKTNGKMAEKHSEPHSD